MSNPTNKILIRNLTKSYINGKQNVPVLKGINLDVADTFLTLMGPSGSGKSTFLNILSGIDQADSGEVWIGGKNLSNFTEQELTEYRRNETGIIFQFFHLLPYLSALENVALPLYISGLGKSKAREIAKEALEKVDLTHRFKHKPDELSGGEQQRVAIARALAKRPSIVLADEPTGNLDTYHAHKILELLLELQEKEKFSLFIVTHDREIGEKGKIRLKMKDGLILHEQNPALDLV
ncbi:ABC transporter ATP-binding protein [Leptospira saintgironsiae]|uniref:Lipoprotein-releasing system ATP-binding protein LolD n=1 Tax=Leptospira saintgironsiae TaxID=2023183 RepID=A0A2M9Y8M0_9LEPT|nr:ABC transporter ATP-binding protein [Leptospira saintgironsiae]PJZ47930.1 lipoprotein-releasing system ATP-binding protein LolD [Leptospira saintgironsiae]